MSKHHDFPFGIMDVVELLHLQVRRPCSDGAYINCPFCGDKRGKMKVNFLEDVWKCNYCGESGGMLKLYAQLNHTTFSQAYQEICNALQNGVCFSLDPSERSIVEKHKALPQATTADVAVIHHTFSGLLGLLKLSEQHREHLRTKRGLTDEQIDALGYKSTPPFYMCRQLTDKLISLGYTVEGVPGFYQKDGKWTVNFSSVTSGFLIPIRGIDGMIHGFQIRLDTPLKDKNDDPEKTGAKYIWLSSGGKPMGASSGSPVHFVGDPHARIVYVTEGGLKADISHCCMNRTFAAIAGINNTKPLAEIFQVLANSGTKMIIEAADMDKCSNIHVRQGADKIYLLAKQFGMDCRHLTWNPNYKGIDEWQLALKRKSERRKCTMNFKTRFLYGLCDFDAIDEEVASWHESPEQSETLEGRLGFSTEEYTMMLHGKEEQLRQRLLAQRRKQNFRIYQLYLNDEQPTIPFAFGGIKELHKAGYEQPPSSMYQLIYDGCLYYPSGEEEQNLLEIIFDRYNDDLPDDYPGRSISPSDIIELYDDSDRHYYYCDRIGFSEVKFSPFLAKAAPNHGIV